MTKKKTTKKAPTKKSRLKTKEIQIEFEYYSKSLGRNVLLLESLDKGYKVQYEDEGARKETIVKTTDLEKKKKA